MTRRAWRGRTDLLACAGGPLDGQWFTPEDWQTRVDAARYLAARLGESATPRHPRYWPLAYARTDRTRRHPQTTDATTGHVLAWRPRQAS